MTNLLEDFEAAAKKRLAALELVGAPAIGFAEFLTSPDFCGPYMGTVTPSPLLVGIALASEGRDPTTIADDEVRAAFHCDRAAIVAAGAPKVVNVNAGRRGGKTSNLLATKCVHAAWTVKIPTLKPGEIARAVIVSPDVDLSEAAFNYCKGIVESSPVLSKALAKPINTTEIVLRRPDGALVEIVVSAANRGGKGARSRTLVFCGMDEGAFFYAGDGYVVNDRDIFDAAMGTLSATEGAQLWIVSTSWIEEVGLMEEFIGKHWGNPASGILVAARLTSYQLRGWSDEGQLRAPGMDDDTYNREILSIPLPRGSFGFFPAQMLAKCLELVPPDCDPEELGAGGDFAFERDCSAAAAVGRWAGGIFAPVLAEERAPKAGDDVAVQVTVRDLARAVRAAGPRTLMADSHRRRTVAEYLAAEGVAFIDAPGGDFKQDSYSALKKIITEGHFALGGLNRATAVAIRDQLRMVTAKPKIGGGFAITQPRVKSALAVVAKGDAPAISHLDVVSAIVLAAWMAGAGRTEIERERPAAPDHGGRFTDAPLSSARRGSGVNRGWLRARSPGLRR